jgi:hypothetical protein
MPIIIQETSVEVLPPAPRPATANTPSNSPAAQSVVPLRPTDVERVQRYLNERRTRVHAD